MIITLAFQKIPDDNIYSKIFSFIIKKITKSEYYHVECFFKSSGLFISSDIRTGVVINPLNPNLSNKYDYFDIKFNGRKYKKLEKYLYKINNSKYDIKGIFLSQLLHLKSNKSQSENKFFCSELVSNILKKLGLILDKEDYEYSPELLYRELNAKKII